MRILIAEDDNTTAMLLTRVLKKAGHEVVRVADGVAALESVKKDRSFDAILTDWMMPKMNGIEFVQEARRSVPGLPPIVVVTSDHGEMGGAENVQPADFISAGGPHGAIQHALEHRRAQGGEGDLPAGGVQLLAVVQQGCQRGGRSGDGDSG